MIEREACSKADLPNWVIYLESVKVGSKATESPGGKSLRGGGGSKRNRQTLERKTKIGLHVVEAFEGDL